MLLRRRALLSGASGLIAESATACPGDGPRQNWLGNVPAPAAAVGYNTRTYGPAVTLGQNWFPAPNSNVVQNSDGSATDRGGRPNHYNAHVASCRGTTGWESGNIVGCIFDGGGYFEWTFSWANPPASRYSNTNGWPALWSWSAGNGMYNGMPSVTNTQVCEVDSYEAYYPNNTAEFNCAPIHWYSGDGSRYGSLEARVDGSVIGPTGFGAQKNKLGMLWVPATANSQGYIKHYINGVQVGRTWSWDRYGGGSIPNQVGGSNDPAWSVIDVDGGRRFLWGTGTKNPLTIYAFEAWQATRANNKGTLA
jgi:hypothetical protein